MRVLASGLTCLKGSDDFAVARPCGHRMQLEFAHLFSGADPNRIANLVGLNPRIHVQINREWAAFSNQYGRTVTAQDVLRKAIEIDRAYGPHYVYPR